MTRDFLLIHGASHGAWCWEKCAAALAEAGHDAAAIDLPGSGADTTPRGTVSASAYVGAVCEWIENSRAPEISLVGHSLAGVILPEIVSRFPGRIRDVTFLAALVLEVGERALDHIPESRRPMYFELAEASAEGSFMVSYEAARPLFFDDLPEADARLYYASLTPQPLSIYLERARVGPESISVPRRYIVCSGDSALGYQATCAFARRLGGSVEEIDSGHDAMLSRPAELADLLAAGD